MKKLFLFVSAIALTVSLNSCSKSDSSSSVGGTITMKINGTSKTFNTVVVDEHVYYAGTTDEYTELTATGIVGTDATEYVTFTTDKGVLGSDAIYSFEYYKNGQTYYSYGGGGFAANVTTNNTSKKLIGSFSGILNGNDSTTGDPITVSLTNGTFNVQY